MNASGQFLTSLKRAMLPIRKTHAREFENNTSDFASPFRAYRDKEGRSGESILSSSMTAPVAQDDVASCCCHILKLAGSDRHTTAFRADAKIKRTNKAT